MSRFSTALALARRGDWRTFDRQFRFHWRARTIGRARHRPFIYRLDGFPFVCTPDCPESAEFFLHRGFDRLEIRLLRAWLEADDSMLDVGANHGIYACAAADRLGDSGAILAVEADPLLAGRLAVTANRLGHTNVRVECAAVSETDGPARFYVAAPGVATGGQSLQPDPTQVRDFVARSTAGTTLRTLSGRFPDFTVPAAIKIDIEGSEVAALHGAPAAWFGPAAPLWIIEINPAALARVGATPASVLRHFPTDRFRRILVPHYPLSGSSSLPPRRLTVTEQFADAVFYNLLAVPRAPQPAARLRRLESALPAELRRAVAEA